MVEKHNNAPAPLLVIWFIISCILISGTRILTNTVAPKTHLLQIEQQKF